MFKNFSARVKPIRIEKIMKASKNDEPIRRLKILKKKIVFSFFLISAIKILLRILWKFHHDSTKTVKCLIRKGIYDNFHICTMCFIL